MSRTGIKKDNLSQNFLYVYVYVYVYILYLQIPTLMNHLNR